MSAALLIIDVQNDFCAGGALAVPAGDEVVPVCNRLARKFEHVVLTQDWHPTGHASFASSHVGRAPYDTVSLSYGTQVLWPDHCVQGTTGADFHPDLDTSYATTIVRKGFRPGVDSYSAFFENDRATSTGLAGLFAELGVKRVVVVGLATDFCVRYTALDARKQGFSVAVVPEACRGIDVDGSVEGAWVALREAGVTRTPLRDL